MARSHCDHCKKDLLWFDLIPILSYVYLGASCRFCGKKLSLFYPMVEVLTGLSFVGVLLWLGQPSPLGSLSPVGSRDMGAEMLRIHVNVLQLLAVLGIVASCIVIFFSDFKYQIIPDSIEVVLFTSCFLYLITRGVTPKIFFDQVISAFVILLPILLLFFITKGRGMGFGDVKLAFNIGFVLGIMKALGALYIGFITGALVGIFLIVMRQKKLKSKIAFGPFLVTGFLIMFFWGDQILQVVRRYFRL